MFIQHMVLISHGLYPFRDEIAGCIEKAYEKIAFSETARMLFFESQKPMKQYAAEVRVAHQLHPKLY